MSSRGEVDLSTRDHNLKISGETSNQRRERKRRGHEERNGQHTLGVSGSSSMSTPDFFDLLFPPPILSQRREVKTSLLSVSSGFAHRGRRIRSGKRNRKKRNPRFQQSSHSRREIVLPVLFPGSMFEFLSLIEFVIRCRSVLIILVFGPFLFSFFSIR